MAVLRFLSTSTKVSGHKRFCSSSRVTTSPGRSSRIASTWNGWPLNFSFTPSLRSSPVRRSASKAPKRTTRISNFVSGIGEAFLLKQRTESGEPKLSKVINNHDVAAFIADERIEDPAAIGRDRQAVTEILVRFKDWPYLLAREIKVAERSGRIIRNKINTA